VRPRHRIVQFDTETRAIRHTKRSMLKFFLRFHEVAAPCDFTPLYPVIRTFGAA
jgi:hypothetical protein